FGANFAHYGDDAVEARQSLIDDLGWSIDDMGYSDACNISLPIQLIKGSFKETVVGDQVLLSWATASESNTKGFTVQRSADGINWMAVGFQASKAADGNSTDRIGYNFTDEAPVTGHNYYRLVEVSKNGAEIFSAVIDLLYGGKNAVVVYPNPASDYINIRAMASGMAQIFTAGGQLVKSVAVKAGVTSVSLSGLSIGIYIVKVDGATTKVIKK